MIRALLYWEVEPSAIAEVGEEVFMQIADAMAKNEADRRGAVIANREETVSDDGRRRILVWNLEEVK